MARALVNKGARLGSLDRSEEEIATYDRVVERFSDSTVPGVQEAVTRARRMLGG